LPDQSKREGGTIPSVRGITSSRHAAGASWHKTTINGQITPIIDEMPAIATSNVQWQFSISNYTTGAGATAPAILQQLRDGQVDDILVSMNFAGMRPAWN
jgi:hypothetical protein